MELFYRKKGHGEPFIIIHGLYGSSDNWLSVANQLSEKFTVYMPDQRNHGLSPHSQTHSYDDLKTDLIGFMDAHNIQQAIILGHSMGGKVAMYFAADYPERVKKLIVADIAPKDYLLMNENSQFYLHRNILLAMQEIDFSVIRKRDQVEGFLTQKIDEPRIRQFLLKNITKDKKSGLLKWKVNAEVLYDFLDEIVGGVNKLWLNDRIPITAYPVTFIKGEKSNYVQDEDESLIKEIYPEAKIISIPDAGHWLHAEQSELFIKAVLSYS
ncbi:MAG: alpha/beta fold hydrolase [Prolixibacteraceae bacterium]|nr:alpha/beta fold hydrolase [Prolixibacteraceae bacterium]MBN2773560.1 alpha/beta fold hydrolase [Prolixibacteraceae bacterium]